MESLKTNPIKVEAYQALFDSLEEKGFAVEVKKNCKEKKLRKIRRFINSRIISLEAGITINNKRSPL